MLNKKGDVGVGAIVLVLIIIIFLGWLVNEGWKECRVDTDCKDNQYCDSKFECNDIPVIEKTSVKQDFVSDYGAWIIGLSLVVAALIFKWDSILPFIKKKKEGKKEEEYIDLSKSHKGEDEGLYEDFLEEEY